MLRYTLNRIGALCLVAATLGVGGCATNPVTGERDLGLVSTDSEINMGRQQYGPSRQAQGGDYSLDPRLTEYVRGVGAKLAAVADRKLPYEFAIINDSTPNAWALPGGKIAVNRGLLTELRSEAELAAVLGHEIVHAAARHGAQGVERGTLLSGALIATALLVGDQDYAGLAMAGAQVGATAVNQKYGRDAEREADFYGIRYMARAGYDVQAAVDLQQTFVRLNNERRQDWLSGLFASHPPSQERVDNNRKTAGQVGRGGVRGEDTYRKRIAYLKQVAPAYDAYDKGREALAKGDTATAATLADRAIAIEPREALFHGLKGDAKAKRGDYRGALAAYDGAVSRDSRYYRHFLTRGLVREKLGDNAGARADLERSMALLPTDVAKDHLVRLRGLR